MMESRTGSFGAPKQNSSGALTLTYVLITPARNEAENIERTIQAVIRQTVKPARWIIVSDGSTDGTDEIVRKYVAEYDWIELMRKAERAERNFAGKAHSFNAGYSCLKNLKFDIIGNLDADLSFAEDYFSFLLDKFTEDPTLGVAGTPFREGNDTYDYRFTSIEHVSGACQLFRRECFEEIGGYTPLKRGGVDLVASITARMNGWKTRTFTGKVCEHHRKTQFGKHSNRAAEFRSGYQDYVMGAHPVWELFRCAYQSSKRPFLIGGTVLLAGYSCALLRRAERPVSEEFIAFRRREQMHRLREFFARLVSHFQR